MLTHDHVWNAIDKLAENYGMSTSGLARKSGLDATSFNRSKRIGPDGRARWPSSESIAKVLNATGATTEEFFSMSGPNRNGPRVNVPLVGLAQAGSGRLFSDDGVPTPGLGWDEIAFPDIGNEGAFALEVQGDSMLPLYRDGDILIVSRVVQARKGDRVVVRTFEGEVLAKELKRQTARTIDLASLNPEHPDRSFQMTDVNWVARILWVRQ